MAKAPFRPMLADAADLTLQRYPVLGSAKLDGVRALAMDGRPMSRSMKVIRNRFVQKWFAEHAQLIDGLDGELIVGAPTADDVYRVTTSAVMSEAGEPDFSYFVFDRWDVPTLPYRERCAQIPSSDSPGRIRVLQQEMLHAEPELVAFEQRMLDLGYEGAILRDPHSPYKQGRSTLKEGWLLKLKRYKDAEAEIIGFEEEMFNGNEATLSELGFTKRSSHQGNKVGKGTLGAWVVRGVSAYPGVVFRIGTGMDAATRKWAWEQRAALLGKLLVFKFFDIGVKDAPRHPVYKGLRDIIDL